MRPVYCLLFISLTLYGCQMVTPADSSATNTRPSPPADASFAYESRSDWIYGLDDKIYFLNKDTGEISVRKAADCGNSAVLCEAIGPIGVAVPRDFAAREFVHLGVQLRSFCVDLPACDILFVAKSYKDEAAPSMTEFSYNIVERGRGVVRIGSINISPEGKTELSDEFVLVKGSGLLSRAIQ